MGLPLMSSVYTFKIEVQFRRGGIPPWREGRKDSRWGWRMPPERSGGASSTPSGAPKVDRQCKKIIKGDRCLPKIK